MVSTPVLLGQGSNAADGSDITDDVVVTLSRAITANELVLVGVTLRGVGVDSVNTPPTVAGGGITWTPHGSPLDVYNSGTVNTALHVFRGVGPSPSGTTVTITPATGYRVATAQVVEVGGADTGGTVASAAIVQTVTGAIANQPDISVQAATLSDPTNNAVVAFGAYGRSSAIRTFSPDATHSFTELDELGADDTTSRVAVGQQAQYKVGLAATDPAIGHTLSGGVDHTGIVVLEIADAGGGDPTTPITGTASGTSSDSATAVLTLSATATGAGTSSDSASATLAQSIMGTVTASGSPVQGATIYLIDQATDSVIATETTAVDGTYEFTSVSPGTYHVVAEAEGYAAPSRSFVVIE